MFCRLVWCTALLLLSLNSVKAQQGNFTQYKYFQGFSKPFASQGHYQLSDAELVWQTTSPVASKLVIKHGQVYMQNGLGELELQAGAEPFAGLLHAILSQDHTALANSFTVLEKVDNCQRLKPTDKVLLALFTDFELCLAKQQVIQIQLNEVTGNYTLIRFEEPAEGKMQP